MAESMPCRVSQTTLVDASELASGALARRAAKACDHGVLVQMSGSEAGRLHAIPEPITLGRGDGCTVRFDDVTLSRVHARVLPVAGEYVLEDLGSLNGCFVNGQRVRTAALADGDRVRLGSGASLRFHLLAEDEERALVRTYDSSIRDGLTGVYNRRHLEERLAAEVAFANRHGAELSLVMLDLDHFKRVNDAHGHLAGDAVLRHAATLVSALVRVEDLVARYGGEELCVLARGIPIQGAFQMGERVRAAVAAAHVPYEGAFLGVTLSAGAASLRCVSEPTGKALVARADERLYRAKALGRNRVVAQ